MSCCPPNAEKYLAPTYDAVGSTHTLKNGHEFYHSGSASSTKAVLLIPDVFGWNGGRIRKIADFFAEAGYYAVVPKLLVPALNGGTDGDGLFPNFDFTISDHLSQFPGYMHTVNFDDVLKPRLLSATAHINSLGITNIHLTGFCWGGWVGFLALADADFANKYIDIAIPHPSVSLEQMLFNRPVADLVNRVNRPVLFMPAKGDPDEYREAGAWYQTLKAKFPTSQTIDFVEQNHGFTTRGDVSDAATKAAVEKALNAALAFYKSNE